MNLGLASVSTILKALQKQLKRDSEEQPSEGIPLERVQHILLQ